LPEQYENSNKIPKRRENQIDSQKLLDHSLATWGQGWILTCTAWVKHALCSFVRQEKLIFRPRFFWKIICYESIFLINQAKSCSFLGCNSILAILLYWEKFISAVIIPIYIYHLHIEMDYFFVWIKSSIIFAAIWRRTMQNHLSTKRDTVQINKGLNYVEHACSYGCSVKMWLEYICEKLFCNSSYSLLI
jgi:hypothetical protein